MAVTETETPDPGLLCPPCSGSGKQHEKVPCPTCCGEGYLSPECLDAWWAEFWARLNKGYGSSGQTLRWNVRRPGACSV